MRSRGTRISRVVLATLAVAIAGAPEAAAQTTEVVERVMAVVDRQIVFSSEVRLVQALRNVTAEAAREALIDELLMYHEASRLGREPVGSGAIDAAFESLTSRLEAPLENDVAAVRRLAHRQLVILSYIEFRFMPLVTATQEEVDAESARQDGLAAETARQLLERRRLDERVEQWIADLRSGANIRYAPSTDG